MKKIIVLLFLVIPMSLSSQNIDIDLLKAIHTPEPIPSDDFFKVASNSYIYVITGVPATMAIVGLIEHDDELLRNAAVVTAGTLLDVGITYAFKYTVKRDRPFETYPDDIVNKSGHLLETDPSFPSGHTSTTFATACIKPRVSEMVCHCPFVRICRHGGLFADAPWCSLSFRCTCRGIDRLGMRLSQPCGQQEVKQPTGKIIRIGASTETKSFTGELGSFLRRQKKIDWRALMP